MKQIRVPSFFCLLYPPLHLVLATEPRSIVTIVTMEELKDRNSYVKATNADGLAILEATAVPSTLPQMAPYPDLLSSQPWCSQCKAIAPFVEKMMKRYPDARFYNYDTDTADDISQELGANRMPTFHAFKDGDLLGSVTGARAAELEKLIKEGYDGKVVEDGE